MELTDAFLLLNSEFWWEPVSQELYGAIAASFIARHHHFVDGCCIFLSDKTSAKIPDSYFVTKERGEAKLNFVINFERFIEDHTGFNIRIWLN